MLLASLNSAILTLATAYGDLFNLSAGRRADYFLKRSGHARCRRRYYPTATEQPDTGPMGLDRTVVGCWSEAVARGFRRRRSITANSWWWTASGRSSALPTGTPEVCGSISTSTWNSIAANWLHPSPMWPAPNCSTRGRSHSPMWTDEACR